jgi:arginine/lysine/ornithine decarboxylase
VPNDDWNAPLADSLGAYALGEVASFHMPGHKQRVPSPASEAALGADIWRHDVSEMGGFDYLHSPSGPLVEAQQRAAQTFGAGRTFFLVGGSTVGNLAAFVAHAGDGSNVVVLRGSHRSVYTGIVLSGARPHYLPMHHDRGEDGWFLADASATEGSPDRLAIVHVTRPNYYGMACDLAPYRSLADRTGAVLVVDEAHGSHFGFHPAFPPSALAEGADIVIQSTHKTLRALTQASMLHLREGFDSSRLERVLPMLQSSSPSALLTVSLDLARAEIDSNSHSLFASLAELAAAARTELATLDGFRVLGGPDTDPAKLVLDVSGCGWTGFAASKWLRENARVWIELADFRRIVCSLTFADDANSVGVLLNALRSLHATDPAGATTQPLLGGSPPTPPQVMPPRTALNSLAVSVSLDGARDRTCAEYVIPYPPGIPLIVPGEQITVDVLDAIARVRAAGATIVGPLDRSGASLQVVATTP